MYSKVAVIGALLAVCQAGLIEQGQGHAVSSQSIIRHDEPSAANGHYTPVLQHATPVIEHGTPVIHQTSPIIGQTSYIHAGPLIQRLSPAVHGTVAIGRAHQIESHAPAHYEFSYSVEDPNTGDHKSQHESRDGDVVKGEYSLLQPDGSIRKVEYTADEHNGFNAIVHNSEPNAQAAPPARAHAVHAFHTAPVVQASPLIHGAPVVHATPVVHAGQLVHAGQVVHPGQVVHAVHAAPAHYITTHH